MSAEESLCIHLFSSLFASYEIRLSHRCLLANSSASLEVECRSEEDEHQGESSGCIEHSLHSLCSQMRRFVGSHTLRRCLSLRRLKIPSIQCTEELGILPSSLHTKEYLCHLRKSVIHWGLSSSSPLPLHLQSALIEWRVKNGLSDTTDLKWATEEWRKWLAF